jgi:DnaK suppressor protein
LITKVAIRVEPKIEKPVEARKEAAVSKPFLRIEKPKHPVGLKQDPRSRYSDKELVEFKDLINKKLEEATRDYELLKNTLSHKDDHGTDDTSPTFKLLEDGSDVLSKEETAHLASRQEKYIQNLKNALIRIENKTYGICRVTGKLIPKERLRSVPHATLSIDAKMEQNR